MTVRRILALLVAVACAAFAGFVLTREPTPPAPYRPMAAAQEPLPAPAAPPVALFVGDSYTGGYGALTPRQGYACRTAIAMGWICNVDAQGGTGYVSDGRTDSASNRPLIGRLAEDAERYTADVVVVDAGRNDFTFGVPRVAAAMRAYLKAAHKAYPDARMVVIVPAYTESTTANYPFGVEMAAEIRAAVKPYDGVVIDPLAGDWRGGRSTAQLTSDDGMHPSPLGHQVWAKRLAGALTDAGLDRLAAEPRGGS